MKIIITAMSMEAGGAETHVYEIVKELHSRGHKIMLVSSGGRLADKISIDYPNILVKTLMLDKKSPFLIISVFKLISYIFSFKPHLIHSHGRIPSAVSNLATQIFGLPLVTTAHGVYKVFPGARFFSAWGTKTTAVSDDIADYLIKNYKIKSKNIFFQKNGIDITKFRQLNTEERDIKRREVLNSLEIEDDKNIILSVSRLDLDAYHSVFELLEAAPAISEVMKDSVLIIGGGGELLDEVKKRAAEINQSIDKDFIIVLGHRDDIEVFLQVADVFIGSARCAIEAAACGCPVIIAGGGNYLGRLDKTTFDECKETNFTARKRNGFNISEMVKDITTAKRGGFEDAMVEYIQKNYCVSASCDSLLKAYYAAMREKGKISCSIFGYYGCGNFGDDMLLSVITNNLRQKMPFLRIKASSGNLRNPVMTTSLNDVKLIGRYNPFTMIGTILSSKVNILGGGELLQDITSSRSFLYYYLILRISALFKKTIVFYSNGIGQLNKKKNIKRMTKLAKHINLITLRDESSLKKLNEYMPGYNGITYLGADECISIRRSIKTMPIDRPRKNFCFIPKFIDGCSYEDLYSGMKMFIDDHSLTPIVIMADSREDEKICNKSAAALGGAIIIKASETKELLDILNDSVAVVSSRLHGLIFSAVSGIAPIALSKDQKLKDFMVQIEQGSYVLSPFGFTDRHIYEILQKAFSDRLERNDVIRKAVTSLQHAAEQNSALCAKLISYVYKI